MNVMKTYTGNLCCSCGLCEGFCPHNAITLKIDSNGFFKPEITNNCINCGICINYCPGINYFEPSTTKKEEYLYGYSNDINLRKEASSGGVATQLIMHLIQNEIVDYAVVVIEDNGIFKSIVTNDLNQIHLSKGSKYCPVKMEEAIQKMTKLNATFVVVAMPCKIQPLQKYFAQLGMESKIKYYISLFCNNTPSYNATEYLKTMLGHKNADKIIYRGQGWPGYVQIKDKNQWYLYPYRKTMALGFISNFKSLRCLICTDPFGRSADISLGDSYFIKEKDDKYGNTFCIVRNNDIMHILKKMGNHEITINQGPNIEKIADAYSGLFNRIKYAQEALIYLRTHNKLAPHNSLTKVSSNKLSLMTTIRFKYKFITMNMSGHKRLWKLLFKRKGGNSIKPQILTKTDDGNE